MALQFQVDSLDGVPEAVRDMYAESNGKFVLQVDGAVPKARLDEFRTTNIATRQELDALRTRYEGIDPDEARKLSERASKERDKKLVDAGKVDELIEARVAAMRADHDKVLGSLTGERDSVKKQLESLLIDGSLRDAALKAGVRPTAVDDVLLRGRQTFRLADGRATAFEGDAPAYGKSGDPLGVAEWVAGLADRAPHLFEPTSGAGAPKGVAGSQAAGKGTIKRTAFDAMSPADKYNAVKTMTIVD